MVSLKLVWSFATKHFVVNVSGIWHISWTQTKKRGLRYVSVV